MDNDFVNTACTAFLGEELIATGTLEQVIVKLMDSMEREQFSQVLIFHNVTSRQIDVDFRGTKADVLERLNHHPDADITAVGAGQAVEQDMNASNSSRRRVGRPKLGVVSGEVTLLPRHWEWLKSQPGGASVTLRKLVDEARRDGEQKDKLRAAQEATYRFMTAMAGNYPHYEEALRALYAGDAQRFSETVAAWAPDVRNHIQRLAVKAFPDEQGT